MTKLVKNSLTHIVAVVILLLISVAYFYPQLEGKKVKQGDVVQFLGMTQEVNNFKKETGETSLWTNSMFGGMPTYQIRTIKAGNNLQITDKVNRLFIKHPIGRFFAAMIGFYILMIVLGVNRWIALTGAIAFGLTTNSLILYEAGHMTKVKAISYFPLVAAGLLLTFRKSYIWGGLLFALGLGLNIMSGHPQMTYYFFLTLIFFGIAQLVHSIRKNKLPHFFKATGVTIVALILALAANTSSLWVTYEYSKDTMRGKPILEKGADNNGLQSSSETDGLAWDYAMQWSNNGVDILSALIPGIAGGSGSEVVGSDSETIKSLKKKGMRVPKDMPVPLYWGALPFTAGPIYLGAIIIFLFIMGLMLVKGPVKWWLAFGTLLTFMLSMGKNMEGFNEFFFNYVPLYNKFRTPNSVLSVASFLMPLLGFLALDQVLKGKSSKKEVIKSLYVSGGITAGISLIIFLLGPSLFDFTHAGDARLEQMGYPIDAIINDRISLMKGDALRTLVLILISAGAIWAFVNKKIKQNILLGVIGVLVLFDFWTIGHRYLNSDDFIKAKNATTLQPRSVDQQILKDPDLSYRVFDVTQDPFQSSFTSYFHKSLGGYHAAKLQRYQDIIDHHLTKNNMAVINMLNTKYFITKDNSGNPIAQQNPGALGNAWFVSAVNIVNTPNEEIDALTGIKADSVAIIHKEFSDYLNGLNIQKNGTIKLTEYQPNHLTYTSQSSSEQLAVFSEIWYGPNKGWQAYIDGKPVDHIRANYILRAMKVPAGSHTIEFKFDPKAYDKGVTISFIFSGLILLAFLGYAAWSLYQLSKKEEEMEN